MAVLWITVLVVLFDQTTKMMVKGSPWHWLPFQGMPYGHSQPLIDDIFRITYIENPGIAFGINIPGFKVVFAVFSIVASIAILIYLKRNLYRLSIGERIALALILGGAVGNLIDRVFYGVIYHEQLLFYGRVVDFIDFGIHRNMFPVFNVADSCVTIGVTLLVILLMRHKPSEPALSEQNATSERPTSNEQVALPS
ncbi:MAG TPA: signal peptidase II [Candidatus Kapabacteria bacterium]|nr:signal peptidase II [Candidatus Kapabacteria bacterium]